MKQILALILAIPTAAQAGPDNAQWLEMVKACEAVITDQDISPFAGYASAPFSYGKPGEKVYAIYNAPETLLAIAKVVDNTDWVSCFVREVAENDRTRWRETSEAWTAGFQESFPAARYAPVGNQVNPNTPFTGALLCSTEKPNVVIMPSIAANFHFRVNLMPGQSDDALEICASRK